MKKSYIFLTTGFEEIEALSVVDVLRRAGLEITTVSMESGLEVTASHGVQVGADILFRDLDATNAEWLILPGGTIRINEFPALHELLGRHHTAGGRIAAICAAPMVLGGLGLLEGRRATCYPGFEQYLAGAVITGEATTVDGPITTGRGPGVSIEFALCIVAQTLGQEAADKIAAQLLLL